MVRSVQTRQHMPPRLVLTPDLVRRYTEVIAKSEEAETFDDLVKYLLMVRKQLKDSKVDTELVYAYAKTNQLGPLEEFISGTHFANLQSAGDRCGPFHALDLNRGLLMNDC